MAIIMNYQLNKKQIGLEQLKMENYPPSPKRGSHPVTDPLGRTEEERGDELITA